MENASKALIMAGSVLLSLLVIGSLVLMFQSITDLKRTEASSEEILKLAEYNKKMETFNKGELRGSEILSLANLIEDYNVRQADLQGYQEIKLQVQIEPIIGSKYFKPNKDKYYSQDLLETFKKLEDDLEVGKKYPIKVGKETLTALKISGMRDTELRNIIIKKYKKEDLENEEEASKIEQEIEKSIQDIRSEVDLKYNNLKSDYTQFKNKKFGTPEVKYDKNNGRITSMFFKEI